MKSKTECMLDEVKEQISQAQNIEEWNKLRGELKYVYPMDIINALETSGFIKTMAWAKEPTKKATL